MNPVPVAISDPARWFDALGQCRCGKLATGILRGHRNESLGPYCKPCADKRIREADKARQARPASAADLHKVNGD